MLQLFILRFSVALPTPLPSSSQGTGGRETPKAEHVHWEAARNSHEEDSTWSTASQVAKIETASHPHLTLWLDRNRIQGLPRTKAPLWWHRRVGWRGGRKAQEGGDICTLIHLGFPGGSDGKESACSAGDLGSIPGLGRSPGGGHGNPLQYSCLENPMDRGAWQATVHGVAKSWTRLRD